MNIRTRTALLLLSALILFPNQGRAHLSGAGGVDQYIAIKPDNKGVFIQYDMHFGELITASMMVKIDTDKNGTISEAELNRMLKMRYAYHMDKVKIFFRKTRYSRETEIAFRLQENDVLDSARARIIRNQGKKTLRINWKFKAPWPPFLQKKKEPFTLEFQNFYKPMNSCLQMAVDRSGSGVKIISTTLPTVRDLPLPPDVTDPITDLSKVPRVVRTFLTLQFAGEAAQVNGADSRIKPTDKTTDPVPDTATENQADSPQDRDLPGTDTRGTDGAEGVSTRSSGTINALENYFNSKIRALFKPPLSLYSWGLALLLAFVWGACHAASPGHGKAIVSAYLVSSRGRYSDAVLLGILVTITHTAVVFVLALAAMLMGENFQPPTWLPALGAVIIMLVGFNQIRRGILGLLGKDAHGHSHDHSHPHEDNRCVHTHEQGDHAHPHEHAHTHDEHTHANEHDPLNHDHDHHGHSHNHDHHHDRHTQVHAGEHHSTANTDSHTHDPSKRHGLLSVFSHHHKHTLAPGADFKDIAAVGISGGMVPCPAAIIMILLAWQLGMPMLGFFCLVSFSAGLALTLMGVGILALAGFRFVLRWVSSDKTEGRTASIVHVLPLVGGILLVVLGALFLKFAG